MNEIVLEDKVYTWDQLLATGFDVDAYEWVDFEGAIEGILKSKCWGRKKQQASIVVSLQTTDGKLVKFTCWQQRKPPYYGANEIPLGSQVCATFKKSRKSGLSSVSSLTVLPS